MKIVVSACLLGVKCRYNGRDSRNANAVEAFKSDDVIPICPEQFGGLPTPRPPAEIVGGDGNDVLDGNARVIDVDGIDRTDAYLHGAHYALWLAQSEGASHAILKSKSPSCGCGQVYDGSFMGNLTAGDGVTTALFRRHGIEVITEDELENGSFRVKGGRGNYVKREM